MGFRSIDATSEDPVEALFAATDGAGVERSVEAVGLPATFLQAVQAAARFGEVLFLGNIAGTFAIGEKDFSGILRKELTIRGAWNSKIAPAGADDWSTVLKFMDRELDVASLVTDRLPLEEGPAIFEELVQRRGFHNKVLFEIAAEANA